MKLPTPTKNLKSDALPEVSHPNPGTSSEVSGFFLPYRFFYIENTNHEFSVIHENNGFKIIVHRIKFKNKWTRKTLVKIQSENKKGREIYTFRGFNLDDLLILKKNWGKILKKLTS